MNNRKYSMNTLAKPNIYAPWLSQFTKPKGPAQKKPSDAQFYMQHSSYIDKFTPEFEHQVEEKETPAALQLDLRNKVELERSGRLLLLYLMFKFGRSEEHTSELQSLRHLVCRLLLVQK